VLQKMFTKICPVNLFVPLILFSFIDTHRCGQKAMKCVLLYLCIQTFYLHYYF
jgi:hypothetical protein